MLCYYVCKKRKSCVEVVLLRKGTRLPLLTFQFQFSRVVCCCLLLIADLTLFLLFVYSCFCFHTLFFFIPSSFHFLCCVSHLFPARVEVLWGPLIGSAIFLHPSSNNKYRRFFYSFFFTQDFLGIL